ncbi:hypothetical protein EVAR_51519_1 [Eumeta japonica]|uniref:Uncharacterized protein n=1 Tax=Eumeta variegata TaxID=151549 RepID=A0A4C1XAW9_EUMVA|nr:hypothetical protein EVAR_51519_1 [Eumeta japonica]
MTLILHALGQFLNFNYDRLGELETDGRERVKSKEPETTTKASRDRRPAAGGVERCPPAPPARSSQSSSARFSLFMSAVLGRLRLPRRLRIRSAALRLLDA